MTEVTRHEIVRRFTQGQSRRQIARELHLARNTVQRVLDHIAQERVEGNVPQELRPRSRRPRGIDAYDDAVQELLRRYPQLTARRVWEELRSRGFAGGYKQVWARVRELRPRPAQPPVVRFETGLGCQAQMDYSVYDLEFTVEGRRRVALFSYVLGYSRRAYLQFVQAQDFETTVRQHIHAFTYLGGAAASCLYDNFKVVVLRYQEGEPLYNPRFLAFATHYGFRIQACRPRCPRTKGKVERHFDYVEKSLLAGRTFQTLDHLNEVTRWWLDNVADLRLHADLKKTPRELHAEELPHLLPLPQQPYNVDAVVYRTVSAEGFIAWRGNLYSVPFRHIGRLLPVRLTESELVLYTPQLEEIVRHPLLPRNITGQRCLVPEHHAQGDGRLEHTQLEERFTALGPIARRFFDGLIQQQRYSRHQARQVLALLATYTSKDILAALERAVRYGAFAAGAIERILAATAQPRTSLEKLAAQEQDRLEPLLRDNPVTPRPTTDYQAFFAEEADHGQSPPSADPPTNLSAPGSSATPPGGPAGPEDRPAGPDA